MRDRPKNVLLKIGPSGPLKALEPHFEIVSLAKGEILASPGERMDHVYFLETGMALLASKLDKSRNVGLGILGREAMTGGAVILGDDQSPFSFQVQMEGSAWKGSTDDLRLAIAEHRCLHEFLLRFVRAQEIQLASTAASHQVGTVETRLVRWLPMTSDRIDGNTFHVTHEMLARLLSVRRPSATAALHELEGKHMIYPGAARSKPQTARGWKTSPEQHMGSPNKTMYGL